jgi:hypothetical protein
MKIISLFIIILFTSLNSQTIQNKMSGNLITDSKILFSENQIESLPEIMPQPEKRKSPLLAGLLSFVIPGSGEIYAESYIKGAVFIALEAAVITTALIYDNKGDKQTEKFEKYADENWSVVKYAEWLNTYKGASIPIDRNPSLPAWQQVNWDSLNHYEAQFSHKLPHHGEQQYYELIGKYSQYNHGWIDQTAQTAEYLNNLTPMFHFYSGLRGEANDLYAIASTAVIGIYINHFLSVIDAVWTTANYNNNLAVKVRMEKQQLANGIELVPTLKLSYNF